MTRKVKHYFQTAKTYVNERSELFVGIGVVAGLFAIVGIVVLINHLSGPQIVYKPAKACDLFTPAEAQSLLGEKINGVDSNEPKIVGNVATSKCSYTDLKADADAMTVAALAVRSGINDEGVALNKTDFATAKSANTNETVTNIGDSAFFNTTNGQLNVLDGNNWLIISYGVGSTPEQNTIEKATELARKVVQ